MKTPWFLSAGVLCICLSAAWFGINHIESESAAKMVTQTVPQLQQNILRDFVPEVSAREERPQNLDPRWLEMTEVLIDDRYYIGILRIPKLELELPILTSWSDDNGKISPCRYVGTVYRNDMILCGHNYESHFGQISSLVCGDQVSFVDMEGKAYLYCVSDVELLSGADGDLMRSGDWDLTLFTCTNNGKSRYTVRCILQNGSF